MLVFFHEARGGYRSGFYPLSVLLVVAAGVGIGALIGFLVAMPGNGALIGLFTGLALGVAGMTTAVVVGRRY